MIESVIVTVKVYDSEEEYDMELPVSLPGGELSTKLLEALKKLNHQLFSDIDNIRIKINQHNRFLEDNETLEKAAVWDGSIITVIRC